MVERVNAQPPGDAAPPDLEEEVRQVLALSLPAKLDAFGRELLRQIRQRPAVEERVEVRHTPAQADTLGWPVAETANFRVIHLQSGAIVEALAAGRDATLIRRG